MKNVRASTTPWPRFHPIAVALGGRQRRAHEDVVVERQEPARETPGRDGASRRSSRAPRAAPARGLAARRARGRGRARGSKPARPASPSKTRTPSRTASAAAPRPARRGRPARCAARASAPRYSGLAISALRLVARQQPPARRAHALGRRARPLRGPSTCAVGQRDRELTRPLEVGRDARGRRRNRSSSSRFSPPDARELPRLVEPEVRDRELVGVVERLARRSRRCGRSPRTRRRSSRGRRPRRDGSSSLRKSAVQRPVNPPPTIATSASTIARRAARRRGGGRAAIQ